MRKILFLFIVCLLAINSVLSIYILNTSKSYADNAPDFSCTATTDIPLNTLSRKINTLTIDSGGKLSEKQVWVYMGTADKGYPIGKFGGVAGGNYAVSNGRVVVNNINSGGTTGDSQPGYFDQPSYRFTVTDTKGSHIFCVAALTNSAGHQGSTCHPVPGNAPRRLTPTDNIIVKVPDILSVVSDPNKTIHVLIARDADGKNLVGNTELCPTAGQLAQGYDMGFALSESQNNYYILVKSSCETVLRGTETGLCPGTFKVNSSGGSGQAVQCPVCSPPFSWKGSTVMDSNGNFTGVCFSEALQTAPATSPCYQDQICTAGIGCNYKNQLYLPNPDANPPFNPCLGGYVNGNCQSVGTGLGINVPSDPAGFGAAVLGLIMGIAGVIALFIIIITGYRLITSQGDPEKVKAAREQLTAAVVGLAFIIFSIAILSFIGVNLLHLPGLG